jgi:NAD(P)-dependent dehydrogenase (short-subunit alcohol dehydrogenase family)
VSDASALPTRTFTLEDQLAFARQSGDFNPMHMDPLTARRTQAGGCVVHGVHVALWAMETLAAREDLSTLASLQIRFDRFVLVDAPAHLQIESKPDRKVITVVDRAGGRLMRLNLKLGSPLEATDWNEASTYPAYDLERREPLEPTAQDMATARGRMLAPLPAERHLDFPHLTRILGPERLNALIATSTIVGMACPGLHSIFSALTLKRTDSDTGDLAFRVTTYEEALRFLKIGLNGAGWSGEIDAFVRHPPIEQPRFAEIARLVEPGCFAGQTVLVIGGSRGLGEVIAKAAAAGGARVTITYLVGQKDAEKVAGEINQAGGHCQIAAYDAARSSQAQLTGLEPPTHVYYLATTKISFNSMALFDPKKLDEYLAVYATGFFDLCQALEMTGTTPVSVLYPSSVAVEDRPKGMTEYAMAKAAGETLAVDINAGFKKVRVETVRLPRLLTDQTASVVPVETPDALATLWPIVKGFQAG